MSLFETITIRRAEPNGEECAFLTVVLHEFVKPMIPSLKGPQSGGASRPSALADGSTLLVAETSQPFGENAPYPNICGGVALIPHEQGSKGSVDFPEGEKVGEIKRTIVRVEARERGVGSKLLASIEKEAKEEGYTYLVVETLKQMSQARRLYERNGYTPRGLFGSYSEEDSVLYEKWLR
ncbi:acyl-CoA N-acyltransferase [Rhizodiscina lignyota]|uniref:Acyl-CoA N-acyltransferase n=1 Tax=Rhizodiscina lignyota TaxID=1504668 RepID=A0A9P4IFY2_9PEZI|nr:acyl-CoA N-acyltransferase [Rhizodiscina lignyota]